MNSASIQALNEVAPDSRVVVRQLTGGRRQRQRLFDMGIIPGALLTVVHNRFDSHSALLIDIEGARLIIPRHISAGIIVEHE